MAATLLVSHKQLGDMLLLQPAISYLAATSGSPVAVLTRSGMKPLINLMPGAAYRSNPGLKWYSQVYCMDHLRKSAVRSLFTPALNRTVVLRENSERQKYHGLGFRKVIAPGLGDKYVARYYWDAVATTGGQDYRPPQLTRPPKDWKPSDLAFSKWIILNPTSGWKSKNWTVEKWRIVCRHLLTTTGMPVFITSGGQDWQKRISTEIFEGIQHPNLHLLAGGTTLEAFIWLVANSSMVITVDGLASHLATAYGIPSVTLFGPTSIENWHRHTPINQVVQAPDLGESERFTIHLDENLVIASIDQLKTMS